MTAHVEEGPSKGLAVWIGCTGAADQEATVEITVEDQKLERM